MNTINCRIKTNDYSDSPGIGVTPAEVILLRTVHDKHAGGCCIKKARAAGVAQTEVGRKPKNVTTTDGAGNEITMKTSEPVYRERTDAEEIQRLRQKYQVRARSGAPGTHICDDLFGGAGMFIRLPGTFAELPEKFGKGLNIEAPAPEPQAAEAVGNQATVETITPLPPAKSPREELLAHSKKELLALAAANGAEVNDAQTKAEIVEAILATVPA